jgi:mono/diheme cytochrome c family protein
MLALGAGEGGVRNVAIMRVTINATSSILLAVFALATMAPVVVAADADAGRRLAQARCASCHSIEPDHHRQVADAPPFELVARKFGDNPDILAFALLDPHPRMNIILTRRETQDIAAYISTLAK